jgi:hypothetical protein
MSLSHVTYIVRYFLHTTPYVSHSTYYLSPITDPRLPSLIYNSFTSHFSYHVSHSYEIYTLCVPFITFWHISNVACHMLSLAYFMSDNLMHVTYHRLCQDISSYTSPIIITYYIVHITYNMSRNHMTYIWNCLLHITPYVSHSTYYLSQILDFISLVYDPFISHVGYHVSHCCEIYTFVSPWSPFDTYLISDVAYHMSSLAYYMSDNLMHITYTDCIKIFQVTHYLSSLPITSYISHITCHYHILHI